jgi:beta-aspartyl-peptidase (threonine type)
MTWSILIHGGAGGFSKAMPDDLEAAYRAGMRAALDAGAVILGAGGGALDAAQAAVRVMEDDPLFNAGRGAVFTAEGVNILDASIMEGAARRAGAVAGVGRIKNPIEAARAVMDRSRHVLLIGEGAEVFAAAQGCAMAGPVWFFTEARWRDLETALTKRGAQVPPRPVGAPPPAAAEGARMDGMGTVGAVARDAAGHLAAATSTGGQTGVAAGRVGDSPIIGAGTYAEDGVSAVSATGTGEYFIRLSIARRLCALVELKGLSVEEAARAVIGGELAAMGGDGGVIALGPDGAGACAFNTRVMFRARLQAGGEPRVAVWDDEPF